VPPTAGTTLSAPIRSAAQENTTSEIKKPKWNPPAMLPAWVADMSHASINTGMQAA
jgi:hypothetical protein